MDGIYMLQVVESGEDLWDAILGDEAFGGEFDNEVGMGNSVEVYTTMLADQQTVECSLLFNGHSSRCNASD